MLSTSSSRHTDLFSGFGLCAGSSRFTTVDFYAWLKEPLSTKAKDDQRLTCLLKQAWLESGCVYGYRKLHDDLLSLGETCCPKRSPA